MERERDGRERRYKSNYQGTAELKKIGSYEIRNLLFIFDYGVDK